MIPTAGLVAALVRAQTGCPRALALEVATDVLRDYAREAPTDAAFLDAVDDVTFLVGQRRGLAVDRPPAELAAVCGHCWGSCDVLDGDSHECRALEPCPGHRCFYCGVAG